MARLVLNHSTNIEGLIKWLRNLSKEKKIHTITPARLYKSKNNAERLSIRISRKTTEGYKLIARKGQLTQEIYLVTKEKEENIAKLISDTDPSHYRRKKS